MLSSEWEKKDWISLTKGRKKKKLKAVLERGEEKKSPGYTVVRQKIPTNQLGREQKVLEEKDF